MIYNNHCIPFISPTIFSKLWIFHFIVDAVVNSPVCLGFFADFIVFFPLQLLYLFISTPPLKFTLQFTFLRIFPCLLLNLLQHTPYSLRQTSLPLLCIFPNILPNSLLFTKSLFFASNCSTDGIFSWCNTCPTLYGKYQYHFPNTVLCLEKSLHV